MTELCKRMSRSIWLNFELNLPCAPFIKPLSNANVVGSKFHQLHTHPTGEAERMPHDFTRPIAAEQHSSKLECSGLSERAKHKKIFNLIAQVRKLIFLWKIHEERKV